VINNKHECTTDQELMDIATYSLGDASFSLTVQQHSTLLRVIPIRFKMTEPLANVRREHPNKKKMHNKNKISSDRRSVPGLKQ